MKKRLYKQKFSKSQLLLFVLAFALIGTYFLIHSLAAGCPYGNAYSDGCSGAPAGSAQYPNMLAGYSARAPWNVAGVDYPVGIPQSTTLTPWRTASAANVNFNLSSGQITCAGDPGTTVTLDSIDFSPASGVSPYIYGYSSSCNWVIKNSKFTCPGSFGNIFADNSTITNNEFDQANCGDLSTFVQGSNLTIKYNWFKHAIQHILESGGPGSIDMEFNLFDDSLAQGASPVCSGQACHENWQQLTGTAAISADTIKFNTNYQHTAGSGNGEGFQFYCNSGPCQVNNPVLSNNTLVCLAGTGMSNVINGGDSSHPGKIVNGTNTNNYFDPSGCTPYYINTITQANHWSSSGNINMKNGKTINPADNSESGGVNVWVATAGNDSTCVRGDSSKPCQSFQKACSIAQAGDVISVAAGSYAPQVVTCTPSGNVTFQGIAQAGVIIQFGDSTASNFCTYNSLDTGPNMGHGDTCGLNINGASNLTFQDMTISDQWAVHGGASNIVMKNINAQRMKGGQFTNLTVTSGSYGPYEEGANGSGGSHIYPESPPGTGENGITITGVTFHDYTCNSACNSAGQHPPDCLSFAGQGSGATVAAGAVLLEKSQFYNCGGYDAWAKNTWDTGKFWFSSITFRNNFFGENYYHQTNGSQGDPFEAAFFSDNTGQNISNVSVLYNTIDAPNDGNSTGLGWCTTGCNFSNNSIVGNILPILYTITGCQTGFTTQYNVVVTKNTACDSTNTASASAMSELSKAVFPNENLHLSSGLAAAVDKGGSACVGMSDIDGDSRPQGTACDAGADEYISGGGSGGVIGDLNSDGHVTILDLSILLSHYGTSGTPSQGDINNDGICNIVDLSILLSHYGT